jgi:hypothetical protein
MFRALGLTAVILPCETKEVFENAFYTVSHLRNLLVYNVTFGNKSYTVP